VRTRFAPSPTGHLHLGHAFSALTAWDVARSAGGAFLLRIEDIDRARCRAEHEAAIYEDLAWLGLAWPEPVLRQSERLGAYAEALARLTAMGLTYPCTCTRRDIAAALAAPQEGAKTPDGPVYPGTCRGRTDAPEEAAVRLDMARAIETLGGGEAVGEIPWRETGCAPGERRLDAGRLIGEVGDVVLGRRDIGASYHLAVVVDDAAQGITHVVRGADLERATPVHRLLQALLGLPVPEWHHHRLIRDESGRRLAKRDDARAIARYRADGASPREVRRLVGLDA
jgi:glutamyl-Q tRNA(Asp) synthetase